MKKLKFSYFTIYLGCLLAVSLLFYVYGYQPINAQTNTLNTQHQINLAQIARNEAYANNLNGLKADTAKLTATLAEKKKVSPVSGSAIADDVNAGLKKASIEPTSVTLDKEAAVSGSKPSSNSKTLCAVPIKLSFRCTSLQLKALLSYYENSSTGAYYVNTVSYTKDQKNGDLFSVNLSMSIYYFTNQTTSSKNGGT